MNAALERAQARMNVRRVLVGKVSDVSPRTSLGRHPELQLAYSTAGQNPKGPFLYFICRYCTACMRGTVIDLVREAPDGTPSAQELGVLRAKTWRLDCNA